MLKDLATLKDLGDAAGQPLARFRTWLFDQALPFWASAGRDAPGLGFHEHLTLAGGAPEVPFKRLRVQARQIYVFSQAALLGWPQGLAAARDSYAFITRHGARADGAWARMLGRNGGTLDPTADLYDLAFVLFALAWYARATGESEPLARARRTVGWICTHMRGPVGGFHNTWPREPGARQQNPHMHLLEAALALFETTPDEDYAVLARELVGLFHDHWLDPATGTLGEFFADDLAPAPGDVGNHVEPGHHYEWVWLLAEYDRLIGGSTRKTAATLYRFAEAFGVHPQTALVVDALGRDGGVRKPSTRLWPQTEAIKAHAVMCRRGLPTQAAIDRALGNLLDRYFADCVPGGWHEHFDAHGARLVGRIPASSFYHIMMGYAELQRSAL